MKLITKINNKLRQKWNIKKEFIQLQKADKKEKEWVPSKKTEKEIDIKKKTLTKPHKAFIPQMVLTNIKVHLNQNQKEGMKKQDHTQQKHN